MQQKHQQHEQQLHFLVDTVVTGNLQLGQYVEIGLEPNCLGFIIGTNPWISLFTKGTVFITTGLGFKFWAVWLFTMGVEITGGIWLGFEN